MQKLLPVKLNFQKMTHPTVHSLRVGAILTSNESLSGVVEELSATISLNTIVNSSLFTFLLHKIYTLDALLIDSVFSRSKDV